MNILSYNPGHDDAIAYLKGAHLLVSIEAEKNSNFRYSAISAYDLFVALGELKEIPDVLCTGGWWPRDEKLTEAPPTAGYRGVLKSDVILDQRRLLGKQVRCFSSSHERSHLLCAFGMSGLPAGTPCYALVWEGSIGAFYEIDDRLNITLLADVMNEPGHRYAYFTAWPIRPLTKTDVLHATRTQGSSWPWPHIRFERRLRLKSRSSSTFYCKTASISNLARAMTLSIRVTITWGSRIQSFAT